MSNKRKRHHTNKKWIPWKELTPAERQQLRHENDKKAFRNLLKNTKQSVTQAINSNDYMYVAHAPRPTNEDYIYKTADNKHIGKWDVENDDSEDDDFCNESFEYKEASRSVTPEDTSDNEELRKETIKERIIKTRERILELEKENNLLKDDLQDLEHLMKEYASVV